MTEEPKKLINDFLLEENNKNNNNNETNILKISNCDEINVDDFQKIDEEFNKYEKEVQKKYKIKDEIKEGESYEIKNKKIDLDNEKNHEILVKLFNRLEKTTKLKMEKRKIINLYRFFYLLKKSNFFVKINENENKIKINNKSILNIFNKINDDENNYIKHIIKKSLDEFNKKEDEKNKENFC